jgi:DNA-binding NarL/FixJ family response regulator
MSFMVPNILARPGAADNPDIGCSGADESFVGCLATGQARDDPGRHDGVTLRQRPDRPNAPSVEVLSEREREVLALMGRGLSNAEIADELHISEVTVKSHIGHIFTKLDLRDRTGAGSYEIRSARG